MEIVKTKDIINVFELIGHDPMNDDYYNKKWVAVEDLAPLIEMIGKMSYVEYMIHCFQNKRQAKKIENIYYTLVDDNRVIKKKLVNSNKA